MQRIEFGQPGELRDRLVASILSGTKTATSRLADDFDVKNEPISRPGERYEIIDSGGDVAAVIEIDEVRLVRLAAVGEDVSSAEGGFFDSVQEWRTAHVDGWQPFVAAIQELRGDPTWTITDDTPVVVRFFHRVV